MSSIKERITKKCHSDPRVTIDTIHTNIIGDLNEEEKMEYYLENGLLLDQYYSKSSENKTVKTKDNTSVLSYFQKKEEVEKGENISDKLTDKSIIDFYMSNIDDTYVLNNEIFMNDKCKLCNNNMSFGLIDSELVCENCGYTEDIIINSEKTSYKDPPREVSYFAYKRINHFNEWLAQFQAKETTDISQEVYNNILKELKKDKNFNINNNLSYKMVRDCLKKLKYNKFYEHIPHIINIISGEKTPILTRSNEEQLRIMFKEIQTPFMNNCPDDRKNFLSYSYVLHKFCELLELDHLLVYFPLLKSREKLQQQDAIWKKICKDLKWQYIPSV